MSCVYQRYRANRLGNDGHMPPSTLHRCALLLTSVSHCCQLHNSGAQSVLLSAFTDQLIYFTRITDRGPLKHDRMTEYASYRNFMMVYLYNMK